MVVDLSSFQDAWGAGVAGGTIARVDFRCGGDRLTDVERRLPEAEIGDAIKAAEAAGRVTGQMVINLDGMKLS